MGRAGGVGVGGLSGNGERAMTTKKTVTKKATAPRAKNPAHKHWYIVFTAKVGLTDHKAGDILGYWTGHNWDDDRKKACIFADNRAANLTATGIPNPARGIGNIGITWREGESGNA